VISIGYFLLFSQQNLYNGCLNLPLYSSQGGSQSRRMAITPYIIAVTIFETHNNVLTVRGTIINAVCGVFPQEKLIANQVQKLPDLKVIFG